MWHAKEPGNGDVSKWVKNSRVGRKTPNKQTNNETNKQTNKDFDQKIKVLKTWGLEKVYANYQEQNLYMDILWVSAYII